MKSQLFREKSIERVSSPEQLNDYIRVANPSVWLAFVAVLFLLVGICIWGIFGRLDTVLNVGAITEGEQTICYVKESDIVIAHRLSTIRHCDRIIVLDGGKIVEDGAYDELLARGGFFAELVERQRIHIS